MKSIRGNTAVDSSAPRPRVLSLAPKLREATLPSTQQLLTEGGDARIQLDPERGVNKYGCPSCPDSDLAAFGSSTASVISEAGFTAAARLRRKLLLASAVEKPAVTYTREINRQRHELARLCGVADFPGVEIVFAASGTDLHLIASQLVAGSAAQPVVAVMVDSVETGSCVSTALSGRHFSTRTALGVSVSEGSSIEDSHGVEVVNVALRHADGHPRAAAHIDAEVKAETAAAIAEGRRVLLTLVDVSKTGMIAPSVGCVADLRDRYPGQVDVLVDACQFRLAPATLRAYLERGFMVAVTGSKFIMGPTFCGALLLPSSAVWRLRNHPMPDALHDYSAQGDWPSGWMAATLLEPKANFGLLLRWEAALQELRSLRRVPEGQMAKYIAEFGEEVRARLMQDPQFEPLPVPSLERGPLSVGDSWDSLPTIFPFVLRHRDGRLLRHEETAQVYRQLQSDLSNQSNALDPGLAALRCQLGQPVVCGQQDGEAISALRLCMGARQIVEAAAGGNMSVLIRAMAALDKAAALVA